MKKKDTISVLYAENNKDDAAKTTAYFTEKAPNINIDIVDSGESLFKQVQHKKYEVLLLDYHLSDMNGIDALKKIILKRVGLPVVIVTRSGDEKLILQALRHGAADFVEKQANYLSTLPPIITDVFREYKKNINLSQRSQTTERFILLIEEDPAEIKFIMEYFSTESSYLKLTPVSSFAGAMELLRQSNPYDLILTNLKVSNISAIKFLQKTKHLGITIPFIILSNHSSEDAIIAGLKLGAYDFIVKRGNYLTQLTFTIENAISRFRLNVVNKTLQEQLETINDLLKEKVEQRTKELQESEERSRLIFENTLDLIAILSLTNCFLYASPSYFNQLGCSPLKLVGTPIANIIHPDDLSALTSCLNQLKKNSLPFICVCRFRNASGNWIMFETTGTLIESHKAKTAKIVVVSRDVTMRKQTEAALAVSEAKFRNLATVSPVGIFQCDENRYCFYVNERWCSLTGLSSEDATGEGWINAIYHEDRLNLLDEWQNAIKNNIPFKFEYRIKTPENVILWVYGKGAPINDDANNNTGYMETIIDITERKKAELALKESEERYRLLVDLSPDTILVHVKGRIVYTNETGIKMFGGRTKKDFLGKNVMDFIAPDFKSLVNKRINRLYQNQLPIEPVHEKLYRLDGKIIDAEVVAAPITYLGKPAVQVIVRDITERKKTEQRIKMLAHAIQNMSECINVTDTEENILFANDAFQKAYGYTEQELIGKSISIIRPTDQPVEIEEIRRQSLDEGWQGKLINRRKDGKEFTIYLSTSVVKDDHDIPIGFVGISKILDKE